MTSKTQGLETLSREVVRCGASLSKELVQSWESGSKPRNPPHPEQPDEHPQRGRRGGLLWESGPLNIKALETVGLRVGRGEMQGWKQD